MTEYARRGGLDVQPPPFECEGLLHAYAFYFPGEGASLQALCDRCLNAPSGGALAYEPVKFGPFGHFVSLTFQHFQRLRSTSPDATNLGMHSYDESSFWVPVRNRNVAHAPIELLIPYMFVNDWEMLASGRETYGFPKEFADKIEMPARGSGDFAVHAPTLENLKPPEDVVSRQILRCEPAGWFPPLEFLAAGGTDNVWPLLEAGLGDSVFEKWLGKQLEPVWPIVEMVQTKVIPLVFLRQIRALAGGPGADLQQIVAANAPFKPRRLHIRRPHVMHLTHWASHPIAQDLGLASPTAGNETSVSLPICVELDVEFGLEPGRVVWPAPAQP